MNQSRLIRTDLAVEMRPGANETEGILFQEEGACTTLTVLDARGERACGKPKGTYITLQMGEIWLDEEGAQAEKEALLTKELRKLILRALPSPESIFVACLGNAAVTADSLGPAVQRALHVSRHLEGSEGRALFGRITLSSLAPGVTGQTGIETLSLIRSAVREVAPSLIIAVDALCARSPDRLCTTVQLCDTGIAPGSGIGNHRSALNRETLGVPVIAIGVPTLVDSATLLSDAFSNLGIDASSEQAQQMLDPDRHFFVTRKETDLAVSILASIIARSINRVTEG